MQPTRRHLKTPIVLLTGLTLALPVASPAENGWRQMEQELQREGTT